MRKSSPWILFAAIFGASFLLWKLALEPHAHAQGELARAALDEPAGEPEPRRAPPASAEEPRRASAEPFLAAAPPASQRVRVVLRLPTDAAAVPALGVELLRLDERGSARVVPAEPLPPGEPAIGPRELVERLRAGRALPALSNAERHFELRESGRYVAAWHAWRPVPGTLTWRPVRGRGEALEIGAPFSPEELVLELTPDAEELALDPALDAPVANVRTHVTEKDG
jgi:hypothetical protein